MVSMKLFFLLYDPRSGSTLLSDLITKNMSVLISPETNLIINILLEYETNHILSNKDCNKILKITHKDRKINDWRITDKIIYIIKTSTGGTIGDLVRDIFSSYIQSFSDYQDYTAFGLKKESYAAIADKLKLIFPDAKFICILRDPRGVFLSKKNSIYTGNGKPFQVDSIKSSMEWKIYVRRIEYIKEQFKNSFLLIKYEDIIKDSDNIMLKISSFLSIDMDKSNKRYYVHNRYKNIHNNLSSKIIVNNDIRWKKELSDKEIFFIELACSERMEYYGYKKETPKYPNKFIINYMLYMIKSLLLRLLSYLRLKFGGIVYSNTGIKALRKRW
jgi:hypothetical protein